MSFMSTAEDLPAGSRFPPLQVRAALLESIQSFNEQELRATASSALAEAGPQAVTSSPSLTYDERRSLPKMIAQLTFSVTNPSWAMEECMRLCPSAELWCGSALPKDVWAPPDMKLTVTSRVSSVNSSLLPEEEEVTKEITVANPKATLQNLRATVAIQFRLNVVAFDFYFHHHSQHRDAGNIGSVAPTASPPIASTNANTVDFSDEKKLLADCGLEEGDHLTVLPKNCTSSSMNGVAQKLTTALSSEADNLERKRARCEEGGEAGVPGTVEDLDEEDENDESEIGEEDGDDEEDDDAGGSNDLLDALQEVVPDITVLRQDFLADPQALMVRIERDHPNLFHVIVQNQEMFVALMNDEHLAKGMQRVLHGGDDDEEDASEWSMGEEDEEMDEEDAAQWAAFLQNHLLPGGTGHDAEFDTADLAELEASGMQVQDMDEDADNIGGSREGGPGAYQSDKDLILSRVPSDEDEKKIQALTELGFTYDQCKIAFYTCHRSIDRASNLLFEAPPEI